MAIAVLMPIKFTFQVHEGTTTVARVYRSIRLNKTLHLISVFRAEYVDVSALWR